MRATRLSGQTQVRLHCPLCANSGQTQARLGVAHKMQAKSAVAPTVTTFDITTSQVRRLPGARYFWRLLPKTVARQLALGATVGSAIMAV